MRNLKGASVVLGILLAACVSHNDAPPSKGAAASVPSTEARGVTLTFRQPPARSVLDVPAAQMRTVVGDGYHPRPDRRFLLAVAQVDHLITGAPTGEVLCTFTDDAWRIEYRGEIVGELPELADLHDAIPLLRALAVRRARTMSPLPRTPADQAGDLAAVRKDLDRFDGASVAAGLRRLDGMWRGGEKSSDVLVLAVQGLSALYLQSYDQLDLADALPAKVLATLIVARTLTGARLVREEALLADDMGYNVHADSVGATLPSDDPVALYLTGKGEALRKEAELPDASHLVRYLYALHLSLTGHADRLTAWTDRFGLEPRVFGLAQLKPLYQTGDFDVDAELAGLGPYITLYDLGKTALPGEAARKIADARVAHLSRPALEATGLAIRSGMNLPQGAVARSFEHDLTVLDARYPGPFLDASTYRAYFTAYFYSAEWKLARHLLDGYASVALARDLAASLKGAPAGPGQELYRWYLHLTNAAAGHPIIEDLISDLDSMEFLGNTALGRTYDEIHARLPYGDARMVQAGKLYASHLDARIANRRRLAAILRSDLRDLTRAEDYYRSILAGSRSDWDIDMWMTQYFGDIAGLETEVRDTTRSAVSRIYGWGLLEARWPKGNDQRLRALARSIIATDPGSWYLRSRYISYLEKVGAYEEALRVVDAWLGDHAAYGDFDQIHARTARARLLQHLGRDREALDAVRPAMQSGQEGAVGRGALVLEDLGQHVQARLTAEGLVSRYPFSSWGRSVLAQILWRQGRPKDAAKVLHATGYAISGLEWRDVVAPAFMEAFAGRRRTEARGAFDDLIEEGVPLWSLEGLPQGVRRKGDTELALALQEELHLIGLVQSLRFLVVGYRWEEDLHGTDSALAWIRPRIPAARLNSFSVIAYGWGAYDLLWTVITHPERGEYPTEVWLMRAAAHVLRGRDDGAGRQDTLIDYYRRSALTDPYDVMGAYLLGLVDESRLLSLATAPDRRCEVAYYLGVKAQAEGRMRDAADWYRVVLATAQTKEFEYGWAGAQLDGWSGQALSFARNTPPGVPP